MDIPFEVDVQWLTQSMIQRACERHMNYHKSGRPISRNAHHMKSH